MVVELNQSKGKILPAPGVGLKEYAQCCESVKKCICSVCLKGNISGEECLSDNISLNLAAATSDHAKLVKSLREGGYEGIAEVISRCGTRPLPAAMKVDIRGNEENHRYIGGVCHCNSMICPLCAKYYGAKRAEKLLARGEELAKHIVGGCDCSTKISSLTVLPVCILDGKAIHLRGAQMFHMVTTIRHRKGGKFRTLVKALRKVHRDMQQEYFWRKNCLGNVRSTELTFGLNGFHPHDHNLLILESWVDAGWFAEKVKFYWERELEKLGRSCDWKEDWFTPVKGENVAQMIHYLNKAVREVSLSSNKVKAPWDLPVEAYVEVYKTGKGLRWFSVSGIWKSDDTAKAENEAELEAERESKDPILVSVPVEVWNKLVIEDRLLIRAVVADRTISNANCVAVVLGICYPQIE
jgi:hypothetical protein